MTVLCSVCGERLEMVEGPKGDLYLHYPSLPKSHQPAPYTLVGDDEQLVDPPSILRRMTALGEPYITLDETLYTGLGAQLAGRIERLFLRERMDAFLARYPKEVDE